MDNLTKKPDQKLAIGAKIGLITNIISIIVSIIFLILVIAGTSIFFKAADKADPTGTVSSMKGAVIGITVVALLIADAISIAIIIMCNNVLKGKASSGLTVGILTLVLAGLGLITCLSGNAATVGVNLIMSGLNIASGVLLIIGKYLPVNDDVKVVESEVTK